MGCDKSFAERLDRLERENRLLKRLGLCGVGLASCLLLGAWRAQSDVMDTLRVHRLEVVDTRGVPLVTLSPTRDSSGGSVVLRDGAGEKRSWWESGVGQARIVFESPTGKADGKAIAGLSAAQGNVQLNLLGGEGGAISSAVQGDHPTMSMRDAAGHELFAAPWKR